MFQHDSLRDSMRDASRKESSLAAYRRRVVGQPGFGAFLKYELITSTLEAWPGGLGVWLRSQFYPLIMREMPRSVRIGANVIVRNPGRISLGARTHIDSFVRLEGASDHPYPTGGIELGEGNYVYNFSIISAAYGYVRTGRNCTFNLGAQIYGPGGVEIGDNVLIGGMVIAYSHQFENYTTPIIEQPIVGKGIRIGNNVWTGAHTTVLDGVTIGDGAVVGTGSVVTRDVPPNTIVVGTPAHPLRERGQQQG